jgi:hypothetical protein
MSRRARQTLDEQRIAEAMLVTMRDENPEDFEIVEQLAREFAPPLAVEEATKKYSKFRHMPVRPQEFVESGEYMDKKGILWPEVMKVFIELNSGKYDQCVLTGPIGVAKTTIALYTQAYQVYLMSCLRDPHAEYGLDPSSEISIIFQSLNAALAQAVDYARFRDMIDKAPYFRDTFPFDHTRESEMRFPNRIIVKPISGSDKAAIGQNVIGGVIDEVNFMAVVEDSKQNADGTAYDQAHQNYNTIARRRESRFMVKGWLPGMVCLVSSRNYPGQLTDKIEMDARTNPRIYVYDRKLWDLQPDRFCGDKFRIFIGDAARKPRILTDEDVIPEEDQSLVMLIPIEYQMGFEGDMLARLRDVAGVSTLAIHPFMLNTDAVARCFGRVQSILSLDTADLVSKKPMCFPERLANPNEPRFMHLDLATSKDSAGVAMGHIDHFVKMKRGDYAEDLPIIRFDFVLEVPPPKGGEIVFADIRSLIYFVRDTLKINIKWVTFDQYQSDDSRQILQREGFICGKATVDSDTFGYDLTKQAFYDGRILAPVHAKAQKEMVSLELDVKKQKIDHPPKGSKDVADAMAGVVLGLMRMRDSWTKHGIPGNRIPTFLTEPRGKNDIAAREKEELMAMPYIDRLRTQKGLVTMRSEDE